MNAPSLPDVFLPYQQRLWTTIDANRVVAVEKSRRTGFSWALGAIAAATSGAARSAGGQDTLYMGYEKDMTREFIDYVGDWAKAFQLAASDVEEFVFKDPEHPDKDIGAFRIRFASGYEVIALPSLPRALRGKQGLVILDEAAFMDELDEVLKAAMALLIWGGKVVVCSTHKGEDNPFNTLINDMRAGRQPGAVIRLTFDEAVAEGLCRRVLAKLGKPWSPEAEAAWVAETRAFYRDNAAEELDGIPNPTSGVYLPGALIEARTVPDTPVIRWQPPRGFVMWSLPARDADALDWCRAELLPVLADLKPDEPHVFGMDFGRIRDLSVIWVLGVGKDLVRRTRLLVELRDVPHEQQRTILFFILDRLPRLRAGKIDAGGNGSFIGEVTLQKYGERIEPLQLSEPWYREHMPPWKAAIEDSMLTLPRDREVLDDLRMVKLVRGVARIPERRRTAEGEQRHGDAAIASVLAYAASRAEHEEYDYRGGIAVLQPSGDGNRRWHDRAPERFDEDEPQASRSWIPELRGFA